jgi:hypothetical protein
MPNGQSLRHGFRIAISNVVERAAEPTPGKILGDIRRFVRAMKKDYRRMRPEARELWFDEAFGWTALWEGIPESLRHINEFLSSTKDEKPVDAFLADIAWLLRQCQGIAQTLPGKADTHAAKNHPLVRAARAAVAVALMLAEGHQEAAVPVLRRLHKRKVSVFVEHLRKARRQPSMLPLFPPYRGAFE